MLAKGNGRKEVCAKNLLSMFEYECWMIRDMGLNKDIMDSVQDVGMVMNNCQQQIRSFEPRVSYDQLSVKAVYEGYEIGVEDA